MYCTKEFLNICLIFFCAGRNSFYLLKQCFKEISINLINICNLTINHRMCTATICCISCWWKWKFIFARDEQYIKLLLLTIVFSTEIPFRAGNPVGRYPEQAIRGLAAEFSPPSVWPSDLPCCGVYRRHACQLYRPWCREWCSIWWSLVAMVH